MSPQLPKVINLLVSISLVIEMMANYECIAQSYLTPEMLS